MSCAQERRDPGWRSEVAVSSGFSLVELLAVLSILAVLAALVVSGVQDSVGKAKSAQCLARMRTLGQGIGLYVQDHGEYPRSWHSAAASGTVSWTRAILPYLGYPADAAGAAWERIVNEAYRCPADESKDVNIFSYGLNVFFELTPDGDDYAGSPRTWRRPANVEWASRTILLAEPKPSYFADHLMCHLWTGAGGAANAVDAKRHGGKANYLFVDGHVERLAISATFDPGRGINLWNPSLAGRGGGG